MQVLEITGDVGSARDAALRSTGNILEDGELASLLLANNDFPEAYWKHPGGPLPLELDQLAKRLLVVGLTVGDSTLKLPRAMPVHEFTALAIYMPAKKGDSILVHVRQTLPRPPIGAVCFYASVWPAARKSLR